MDGGAASAKASQPSRPMIIKEEDDDDGGVIADDDDEDDIGNSGGDRIEEQVRREERPDGGSRTELVLGLDGRGGRCDHAKIGPEIRSKTEKIKEIVEQAASEDSKNKIERLIDEIHQLSDLEKLLLYLRLPTGTTVDVDPLKQAFISSLGNRYEVTQTVTWIQTHLEEDNDVSLPKQEVYDGYCEFCERVKMKPLSTADFGKVMKQVFPGVRPRRLGTRGNSRYCYAGLRKKLLLTSPQLPDLSLTHEETCEEGDPSDPELTGVSSHLVREWSEKLFSQKFSNLRELACYLVENAYVNNRSVAAFTLLSYLSSNGIGKGSQSCILMNQCAGSKHRETQLQLQRKLHERELIREQKKKLMEQRSSHVEGRGCAVSEVKGRKSQLSKTPSIECQRNLSLFSPTLENGTRLKIVDFGDSMTMKSCETTIPPSEVAKKTKTKHDEAPVRLFQTKSTLSACTSPLPKFGESMRSRSSSDSIRPRNSISLLASDGEIALQHQQKQQQQQQSTKIASRVPELFRSSSFGSSDATNKTGKVRIPRVSGGSGNNSSSGGGGSGAGGNNNGGSKMTCLTPASIIIFPQISEYSRSSPGSHAKPKYKPIQPKPIDRCPNSSDEACSSTSTTKASMTTTSSTTAVSDIDVKIVCGGGGGPSTISDEDQQNERENHSSIPAGSQLSTSDVAADAGPSAKPLSSINSPVSVAAKVDAEADGLSLPISKEERCCKPNGRGDNSKNGGRRKQVKRTSTEPPKRSQNLKNKRLCLASTSNGHQSTSATSANVNNKEDVSPENEMSINTLENDAWDEYLEGGVPSVDQEDELLQYFGEDDVLSPIPRDFTSNASCAGTQSMELSQLRRLLERNLLQRAAATRDDQHDDKAITSSQSMPTLRLLLSSTKQQQTIMEGDGITSDSCLSHTSSRMPSPVLVTSGARSPQPPSAQYFASAALTQGDDPELGSRGVDTSLVLDASGDYVHGMSRDEVWSSQESAYGVLGKATTGNAEEPMFSSSDSSSGCHVTGPSSYPSSVVHFEDTRSAHALSGGGGGGSGGCDTEFQPYNGGGYYQEAANYVASPEQRQQQQQQLHHHHQTQQAPVGQCQSSSVPPSPNTRRRAFNFLPISPRNTPVPEPCSSATHSASHSPLFFTSNNALTSGGHMAATTRSILTHTAPSLSASTATSPFVSPRSTPSSNCRSRHNSGQQGTGAAAAAAVAAAASATAMSSGTLRATPHSLFYLGEQQLPCSMTSSPFASPHPTPVPFSRSRHNSSQNIQRSGGTALMYASAVTRSRHASDVGMMSMMMSTPSVSAPLSPLDLHKEMDPSAMRSRHNSNSSIPPNSPAASSAPLSPMVNCSTQEVFSPGYMTSQQQQQRNFHPASEVERMNEDCASSDYHSNYRHPQSQQDTDPRNASALQQYATWPLRQPQVSLQMDPRLVSRQRHASMGATVHHYALPPPPRPPPADAVPAAIAIASNVVTATVAATGRHVKKSPPAPLPSLDAMVASRCRSVPIYQMLENAIQQPDSSVTSSHVDESSYDDVMTSKSYPATPIGQQQSFTFDTRMCRGDFSPMVTGARCDKPVAEVTAAVGPPTQAAPNGDTLEMPANEFQAMLNTTLDDLTYDDDISKFAQELEQYTQ